MSCRYPGAPPPFWGFLLLMRTPFDAELPNFDVATPLWRGLVLGSVTPHSHFKGTRSQRSSILGVYAYTLYRRTTKFEVVTRGEERVFWGQPRLPSQESGVMAPQLLGSPVFMPTHFNAERPNSAW